MDRLQRVCFVLLVVFCGFLQATGHEVTKDCDYVRNPFTNTSIRLVRKLKTWDEAKFFCEANNEYFATFLSLQSASWFLNLRKTNPEWAKEGETLWIGARQDINDVWTWYGYREMPLFYNQWHYAQPDNAKGVEDCLESYPSFGTAIREYLFNDRPCGFKTFFVCEKK